MGEVRRGKLALGGGDKMKGRRGCMGSWRVMGDDGGCWLVEDLLLGLVLWGRRL